MQIVRLCIAAIHATFYLAEMHSHLGLDVNRYQDYASANVQCYSCMSNRLQGDWKFLRSFYREPISFTEYCDKDIFQRHLVATRNCTNYCIWINGNIQIYGQQIPVTFRGCLSDLIGYRQHAISQLKASSSCMSIHLTDLYENSESRFDVNEKVVICGCRTGYCNGVPPKPTSLGTAKLVQYGHTFNIDENRFSSLMCHSCMSKRLEDQWSIIWRYFRRPEQYKDNCGIDSYMRVRSKGRMCGDFCVWAETSSVHEGSHGLMHFRGCVSDLIRYRYEPVVTLRIMKTCVRLRYSELFFSGHPQINANDTVTLCSCHSTYCDARPYPSSSRMRLHFRRMLTALAVIVWSALCG